MSALNFDAPSRLVLGQKLKFLAQSQGLTQKELAHALSLSTATVSKIWSGQIKKPRHYQTVAEYFDVSLEDLVAQDHTALEEDRREELATTSEPNVVPISAHRAPPVSSHPCQVITIAARKGGATKTTTTVHLCAALASSGYRVLLIDLDGQRDSTEWLLDPELAIDKTADDVLRHGLDPRQCIVPSLHERLDVLPASMQMDSIEAAMAGQWGMERRLDGLIEPLRERYDFILFDCPAAMDFRIVSALMSSQWALIPTTASTLDLKGLISFIPRVLHFADPVRFNPRLQFLGILVSRVKRNTLLARDAREWLGEEFEGLLFDHVIHESTRYQELAGYQSLIFDHDPEWGSDYTGVAAEILERVGFTDALPAAQGGETR